MSCCGFCGKKSRHASDNLKVTQATLIAAVASQFANVDTIPNAVRSAQAGVLLSAAELVQMVSELLPTRLALLVQFGGFVYVDGQARTRRTLSGSISRKIGENVSKWEAL